MHSGPRPVENLLLNDDTRLSVTFLGLTVDNPSCVECGDIVSLVASSSRQRSAHYTHTSPFCQAIIVYFPERSAAQALAPW